MAYKFTVEEAIAEVQSHPHPISPNIKRDGGAFWTYVEPDWSVTDAFDIELPSDVTEWPEKRINLLVDNAREAAHLYVVPCEWGVMADNGERAIVLRNRNA